MRVPIHVPLVLLVAAAAAQAQAARVDGDSVIRYVTSCRKANGAFGPADQEYTDAAWNYPAVRTLLMLDQPIDNRQAIVENGLGHPSGHVGYGHWQFFHQHVARKLLDKPVKIKNRRVRLVHQGFEVRYYGSPFGTDGDTFFNAGGGSQPDPRDVEATELGFYNLSSLYYLLAGLEASGREAANPKELISFITRRQAPCGGFVDVRTSDGTPTDEEVHVAHTFHAVAALRLLQAEIPRAGKCTRFVRACQVPSGAFQWNPDDQAPGNYPDVYYAWAAIGALKQMGAKPTNVTSCIDWINRLQNHDGGFGDQPGWRSRLYSTYYAVHSLAMLTSNARDAVSSKHRPVPKSGPIPEGYGVYQALNKTPTLERDDLEGLRGRGFDLLALKSDDFALAGRLHQAGRALQPPMEILLCPEAYPHRTQRFGGTLLHHVANVTLDPGSRDQQAAWQSADSKGKQGLAWSDYRQQVIRPLHDAGSLVYPEQDFEMEYAYSAYDDGVHGRSGYNAVLAGFNWSPRDFVRVFPWRERYVDKLAPVADADAHGDLKKWSPQLDHVRHLFIAQGPAHADFREAAANGRVVCVIHDAEGVDSRATYYGRQSAVDYVRQRVDQWRWWQR